MMVWDLAPSSYHAQGTIPTRDERATGEAKAQEQEAKVLAFFRANPGAWSPSQVHERVFSERVPITSTRRALSNLADKERYPRSSPPLRKTEQRVDGPRGRPEHTWELSEGRSE